MNPYLLGVTALGNLAGGIFNYKQQQKEVDRQKQAAQDAIKAEEAKAKAARAGMPDFSLGRGARDAYMRSQQDRAGDLALQEVQRTGGDALRALEAGGARSLMFAPTLARKSAMDTANQLAAQQGRMALGAEKFATKEQNILDKNITNQRNLGMYDYGQALGRKFQAERALKEAEGMGSALFSNLLSDSLGSFTELGMTAAEAFPLDPVDSFENGAKIKETPGEFSHKTNPIDLIRNGKKIGEATGGELIFNPEQSGKLEQLASEGSTDLHRYLKGLFKKFNTKK
tara:strand:- start:1570 stop:2424 length:855 start_codon:yes stop_codon:yes gene_type:complete